ncbi:type II secretion system F family protein [Actinomycetaceae bacterium L2_0104]
MGVIVGMGCGLGLLVIWTVLSGAAAPWHTPSFLARLWRRRREFLAIVACGLLGGLAAYVISRNVALALCVAVGAGFCPSSLAGARRRRRRARAREEWPDVLDDIVSALRAGLGIGEALASLAVRGPEALRPFFAEFAAQLQATGRLDPALDNLKDKLADPVADRVLEAMRLASRLGGHDLAAILRSLATGLRAENRARGELLARQSWSVNGARVAAIAPWIVLALLATRPGTIEAFATAGGTMILIGGFFTTVCAYALMVRLGRLPEEPRVLIGTSQ